MNRKSHHCSTCDNNDNGCYQCWDINGPTNYKPIVEPIVKDTRLDLSKILNSAEQKKSNNKIKRIRYIK